MGDGKKKVRTLATVTATDTSVRFDANTPDLSDLLKVMGRNFEEVQEPSLGSLSQTYVPVKTLRPDCRYTLV